MRSNRVYLHLRLLLNSPIVWNVRHLIIRVASRRLSRISWSIGESCIWSILGIWPVSTTQSVTLHRDDRGGGSRLEIGVRRAWIVQRILFWRREGSIALRDELSDVLSRWRTSQQRLR